MKPFLLIQSRPEDETSDNEYEAFMHFGGLRPEELVRIRAEKEAIGEVGLEKYSGIIIGGGPFNMSDPPEKKSSAQQRVEGEIFRILDKAIESDFPILAACYGIGLVTAHQNGVVSTKYGEQLDAVEITITEEGLHDPLLEGVSSVFRAFVGHKEAADIVPKTGVLLASSNWCPVQMYRIKNNIYVTQFHPELDSTGLEVRIRAYRHHGYFDPDEMESLIEMGRNKNVVEPQKIVRNFVERYGKAYGI